MPVLRRAARSRSLMAVSVLPMRAAMVLMVWPAASSCKTSSSRGFRPEKALRG
jgi:hypothetical protein